MTDRDPDSGQFVSDNYDGSRQLEFTPMPDEKERVALEEQINKTYGSSDDEIRRAAREIQERRGGAQTEEPEAVQWYARDEYGRLTNEPLDPNISTTKEQAADALTKYRETKAAAAQEAQDRELKNELDGVRIGLEVTDPSQAAKYEFKHEVERAVGEWHEMMGSPELPQPPVDAAPEQQPARESVPGETELAKLLENPLVRNELEQQLGQYADAIQQAGLVAQSALLDHLPELAQIDRSMWPTAIEVIGKQSPERVQRATGVINRAVQIGAEQQRLSEAHQAKQTAQRNAEIEKWSRAEGAKYDAWAAKEGLDMNQVAPAVARYVETNLGLSRAQFAEALRANPVLRSAEFQKTITHAAKWQMAQEARRDVERKPLPPAVRPGAQAPGAGVHSNAGKIAELNRQLSSATGMQAIRIASQITSLRRK
jgi:hypothetical protein